MKTAVLPIIPVIASLASKYLPTALSFLISNSGKLFSLFRKTKQAGRVVEEITNGLPDTPDLRGIERQKLKAWRARGKAILAKFKKFGI